jgi:pimeloyl-ACP methyl ester carboxylesterase
MQQPTLWVFGELDDSNPTALDLDNVKRLAASGRAFTWIVVPGAGHEFTDALTGEFNGSWIEPVRHFVRGD